MGLSMKKIAVFLLLTNVFVINIFAESTQSIDLLVNIISEPDERIDNSMISLGLNVNWFWFGEDNSIGAYYNIGLAFITKGKTYSGMGTIDSGMDMDFIAGMAYKIPILDTMRITIGIGPHLPLGILNFKDTFIGFGVGITIAFNMKISEKIWFDIGSTSAYDFLELYSANADYTLNNYGRLKTKPFFGITFKH
jgi:hypothetical protein